MRFPILLKIKDRDKVLTDVDLYQVENMIWLRIAPVNDNVKWVKFEIGRLGNDRYGREHVVQISTKLRSGKVVETCTTRISKAAALVASVDQMKVVVERRLRFESGWFFRSTCWITSVFGGNLGTAGSFHVTGNNCSSSAP